MITDGWPKRVGGRLFCRSAAHEPVYLPSSDCLFGWIAGYCQIDWRSRDKVRFAVPQGQFYEYLKMTAEQFNDIELMPHWPEMAGTYYLHRPLPAPSGESKLDALLDMLCPETPADRELMKALVLTLVWGGPAGSRPAFLVTGPTDDAKQGRGVGKSTLAEVLAYELAGGCIEIGSKDDLAEVKTRLLSPAGCHSRMARIDNLKTEKFSWSDLEGFITAPMISGRKLYEGEGQRKNVIVWLITVNGANLSKDMAQRIIPIRLKRLAEYGPDWKKDFRTLIREHRWEIIAEAIALLQAPPGTPGRYTRWSEWERDVLSKVGMAAECQRLIAERQGEFDADEDEKDEFIDIIATRLRRHGYDPSHCCCFIESARMAAWINEGRNTREPCNRISAMVNRMAIRELRRSKSGQGTIRGFVWTGAEVPVGAEPLGGRPC